MLDYEEFGIYESILQKYKRGKFGWLVNYYIVNTEIEYRDVETRHALSLHADLKQNRGEAKRIEKLIFQDPKVVYSLRYVLSFQ